MKSKTNRLHRWFVWVYNEKHKQSKTIGKILANVRLMTLFKEMKNGIRYSRCFSDESGVSNFLKIVLNVNLPEMMEIGGFTHG